MLNVLCALVIMLCVAKHTPLQRFLFRLRENKQIYEHSIQPIGNRATSCVCVLEKKSLGFIWTMICVCWDPNDEWNSAASIFRSLSQQQTVVHASAHTRDGWCWEIEIERDGSIHAIFDCGKTATSATSECDFTLELMPFFSSSRSCSKYTHKLLPFSSI